MPEYETLTQVKTLSQQMKEEVDPGYTFRPGRAIVEKAREDCEGHDISEIKQRIKGVVDVLPDTVAEKVQKAVDKAGDDKASLSQLYAKHLSQMEKTAIDVGESFRSYRNTCRDVLDKEPPVESGEFIDLSELTETQKSLLQRVHYQSLIEQTQGNNASSNRIVGATSVSIPSYDFHVICDRVRGQDGDCDSDALFSELCAVLPPDFTVKQTGIPQLIQEKLSEIKLPGAEGLEQVDQFIQAHRDGDLTTVDATQKEALVKQLAQIQVFCEDTENYDLLLRNKIHEVPVVISAIREVQIAITQQSHCSERAIDVINYATGAITIISRQNERLNARLESLAQSSQELTEKAGVTLRDDAITELLRHPAVTEGIFHNYNDLSAEKVQDEWRFLAASISNYHDSVQYIDNTFDDEGNVKGKGI